jgi:hypothetical protein
MPSFWQKGAEMTDLPGTLFFRCTEKVPNSEKRFNDEENPAVMASDWKNSVVKKKCLIRPIRQPIGLAGGVKYVAGGS